MEEGTKEFICSGLSYNMVVTVLLGIMEVLGFSTQKHHPKPASHFLFNYLAVLIRHSQAQKCLQINAKLFQQVAKKFSKFPI